MFKSGGSFNVMYIKDVNTTHDFYKKLGLEITELEAERVTVKFDTFDLHFVLNSSEPFDAYKYVAAPENYGNGVIFYVETDQIEALQRLIPTIGGEVKSEIIENLWGYNELLFEDPNGFKFAAYQER